MREERKSDFPKLHSQSEAQASAPGMIMTMTLTPSPCSPSSRDPADSLGRRTG